MAKAVVKGLGGGRSHSGYYETEDYLVVAAVGHIVEQADPEAYGAPKFPGTEDTLPIIPKEWIIQPVADKKAQVSLIKKLCQSAPWIVHSGDPDREGQMIIDELLDLFGNRKPVKRVLLPDTTPKTVKKAFANLEDNQVYAGRYAAALGRSRADWKVGMNMSRKMSIQGRKQGYFGTLSVGRIQTPTLAIVVQREREIRNFKPVDHFSIQAHLGSDTIQPHFWAKWYAPGVDPAANLKDIAPEDLTEEQEDALAAADEAALQQATPGQSTPAPTRPSYLDEAGRLVDRTFAQRVVQEIEAARQGQVVKEERKEAAEPPPLLFDLNTLSSAVERLYGMSGADALKACQSLYQAGYQSYPRTESGYLPTALKDEVPDVLAAIAKADAGLAQLMGPTQPQRESRIWNDSKTEVHYGLIPTTQAPDLASLTPEERQVYLTVARQYVAQFYPDCIVDKAMIELQANGHRLVARGRVVKSPGWRVLFSGAAAEPAASDEDGLLPRVSVGQQIPIMQVKLNAHRTSPPNRYTEGTLKAVMKHVARLVTDPKQRKMLRKTEGIGTAATRIPMIKTLLSRGLLLKAGKYLKPALIAEVLVDAVPPLLTSPALTAQWEMALTLVEQGKLTLAQFEEKQDDFLRRLLQMATEKPLPPLPAEILAEAQAKSAKKFGNSGKTTRPAGPPAQPIGQAPKGAGETCPACKKGKLAVRVVQKEGPNRGKQFLACSNCKHMEWPK